MENFLKDYVKTLLEVNNKKITENEMQIIIESLMNNDEIWQTLDGAILELI